MAKCHLHYIRNALIQRASPGLTDVWQLIDVSLVCAVDMLMVFT